MRYYGETPEVIEEINIDCKEMMFYQYLPIKLSSKTAINIEKRLRIFESIINIVVKDFINNFGNQKYIDSYVYLTAKRQYQSKFKLFNRPGYHSDGFMTDDINYVWSDNNPTIFCCQKFDLTLDDNISLKEMEKQAISENERTFKNNMILRLDQYNIHKVNENIDEGFRTFVKISFSKDKYDLEGNSHNYELDYKWEMKPRKQERNIPQSKTK